MFQNPTPLVNGYLSPRDFPPEENIDTDGSLFFPAIYKANYLPRLYEYYCQYRKNITSIITQYLSIIKEGILPNKQQSIARKKKW